MWFTALNLAQPFSNTTRFLSVQKAWPSELFSSPLRTGLDRCRGYGCQLPGFDEFEAEPIDKLLDSSIIYRIAVRPQQGREAFTLQALPARGQSFENKVEK